MTAPRSRPRLGAHVEEAGTRFAAFTEASACAVQVLGPAGAEPTSHAMRAVGGGYFELLLPSVGGGALYYFVIDGRSLPDPYARFLPHGVHGPALVVTSEYRWQNAPVERRLSEQVIYELHIGTFTEAGTYAAASQRLPALAELGVTTIELMPVAAFAGSRGWGYDGVALYAPHAAYGTPDELRALVDAAHSLGLGVLLDVVYNHFGPAGNYLSAYAKSYFSSGIHNAWGNVPNFSDPALRELVLHNARYWFDEFRFDGLRLDAVHAIVDVSPLHVLRELAELAQSSTPARLLIAEDDRNQAALVTDLELSALWADDFHHQLRVTLTGERDGYYTAYEPGTSGIATAINEGWLFSGRQHPTTGKPRGTPAHALAAESLVYCIQNHDQIGNRAFGDRLTASIGLEAYRAISMLLLFLPMTPLLFMGQEWAASTPFLYFTDHDAELGELVRAGRRREFAAFSQFADEGARSTIPDPQAESTLLASRLDWSESEAGVHAETRALYKNALALRQLDPVLRASGRRELSAQALGDVLCVRRWFQSQSRLLLVNLGRTGVALDTLMPAAEDQHPRILLRSSPGPSDSLPGATALLLATPLNPNSLQGHPP